MDSTAEVPDPEVPLPQPRNAPRPRPVSERARLKTAEDHASLLSLKLNRLDRDLTEQERQEWNDIYASFRAKSVLTGKVIGVDGHTFNVRNRETGALERRVMHCAVIIQYRVKVLIPETEMWVPGQERPSHVLRYMTGAEIGYTILDVDRKGGVVIASRRMAAVSLCRAFDNVRGGHFIKNIANYGEIVISFGTVHRVIHGDEAHIVAGEDDFRKPADLQIVSAKSAHVLNNPSANQTLLHQGKPLLDTGAVEVRPGVAVVYQHPGIRETVGSGVAAEDASLICNRV